MSNDIFIKIQGIDGESQDAMHLNEIDVVDWTWKVEQQSTMMSGSGGGAAKATVSDLEFTHMMDRASPNLARHCFTGKHIQEARLTMRKAGGVPHEFLRITLYDVVISRVQPLAGGQACIEKVGLSFARMKKEYILQNAIGGNAGTVTALIDVKENISR
ncbi:type VI secretion system tube protein Hcp [Paraburkholderia diazotrophica]|uniref:Hcp family type VI secretion system effector n=1 Tax=Paraburkholderia diazotrophica TaxID=667676 RepID=UPI003177E5F7